MKIYQLDSELKRHDIVMFTKDIESIEELVKRVAKNKWKLMYDRLLDSYSVYVENIPKKKNKSINKNWVYTHVCYCSDC